MTADTINVVQAVFARLARETSRPHRHRPAPDDRVRAPHARPPRDNRRRHLGHQYMYRGGSVPGVLLPVPVATAVKEILKDPQTRRPELDDLCDEVKRLCRTERKLRSDHADRGPRPPRHGPDVRQPDPGPGPSQPPTDRGQQVAPGSPHCHGAERGHASRGLMTMRRAPA